MAGGGELILGIRPDGLRPSRESVDNPFLRGQVILNEYLGRESYLHIQPIGLDRADLIVEASPDNDFRLGETVALNLKPGAIHVFDAASGQRQRD